MLTPTRSVVLPTGELRLHVAEERWPLDVLCNFAARRNPRRGFLIVSRVLGRHIPARPAEMRRSARDLALLLPGDLPGPVLVVGLAETAVCLAQTLFREWRAATGRDDLHFIHSTRQQVDHPLLCRFEEPHSHASAHLIYRPATPWLSPRSLVLVDDEISTGRTLTNLAGALVGCWPGVEAVVAATLTDWSGGEWTASVDRPTRSVSLLAGRLDWRPDHAVSADGDVAPQGSLGSLGTDGGFGRLGWRGETIKHPDLPNLAKLPTLSERPLRIVGTGEFTFPPFLLAEKLEAAGCDVVVQATSRSPVRIGGAMTSAITFADNYATGVPNYLYNAGERARAAANGRTTFICHETPSGSIDPALIAALGAETLRWPA